MASIKSIFSFVVLALALICSALSGIAEAGGDKGGDVIIIGADGGAGNGGGFGGFGGGAFGGGNGKFWSFFV